MHRLMVTTALVVAAATVLDAHVTVRPRESKIGAEQRYTIRVPTEGAVSTTKVELEIPAGLTVTEIVPTEGVKHDAKRVNGRIVSITWTKEIKPKESAEFVFVATNPKTGTELVWKAHQHFADGTSTDWTGPPSKRPASATKLLP